MNEGIEMNVEKSSEVKSIVPVQVAGKGWDVRCRLKGGAEALLNGSAPWTLAQAEVAAQNARRDVARHGVSAIFW